MRGVGALVAPVCASVFFGKRSEHLHREASQRPSYVRIFIFFWPALGCIARVLVDTPNAQKLFSAQKKNSWQQVIIMGHYYSSHTLCSNESQREQAL